MDSTTPVAAEHERLRDPKISHHARSIQLSLVRADRVPSVRDLAVALTLRSDYVELFSVLPSEEYRATRAANWSRLKIFTSHSAAAVNDSLVAQFYLETGLLALLEIGSITR